MVDRHRELMKSMTWIWIWIWCGKTGTVRSGHQPRWMCGHRHTRTSTAWEAGRCGTPATKSRQEEGGQRVLELASSLPAGSALWIGSFVPRVTARPQTTERGWELAPGAKQDCTFPRAVSSNTSLQPSRSPGSTPWAGSLAVTTSAGGRPDNFKADNLSHLWLLRGTVSHRVSTALPPILVYFSGNAMVQKLISNLFFMFATAPRAERPLNAKNGWNMPQLMIPQ